jgi:hypothetical protein
MRTEARQMACFDERNPTDHVGFAEAAVAGLLTFVATSAQAKRRLGLKAASRRADGWPAWYLWLAGWAGAFELILVPPGLDGGTSGTGVDFALRYYPDPEEDAFAGFAAVEREARCSARFDHTGTPAVGMADLLDPSLFHTATLRLTPRPGGWTDAVLTTQDCWREVDLTDAGPVLRRSVRGAELAAPVLDLLVCAHTLVGRQPPAAVDIRVSPAVCWCVDRVGRAEAEPAPDLAGLTVSVAGLPRFGVPRDQSVRAVPVERDAVASGEVLLRHDGPSRPPALAPFDLSAWWDAATWRLPPTGLMCGCHPSDAGVAGPDEDDAAGRPLPLPLLGARP